MRPSGQPLSGTMKPYPFEASNHLMTPEISTRLAASPKPDSASIASREAPPPNSPAPRRLCGVPPDTGTPFLDSNPSDPITPDLTRHFCGPPRYRPPQARPHQIFGDESRESLRIKR